MQETIDALLEPVPGAGKGNKNVFDDLRRLLIMVLYTGTPDMLDSADAEVIERFKQHAAVRDAGPRGGSSKTRSYRSYGHVPTDPLLVAGVLIPAAQLAFSDDPIAASKWYVDRAAHSLADMPSQFYELEKYWKPPRRLQQPLRAARDRYLYTVSPALDGRANRRILAIANHQCDFVPGLLWPDAFDYLSAGIIVDGRTITDRRFAAIALARTLDPSLDNWAKAAQAIGHAPGASNRSQMMMHKIRRGGHGDVFGQRLDEIARRVLKAPTLINYGVRRAAFMGLRDIEPEDWEALCGQHRVDPHDRLWNRHRRTAAAWLWATLTAGDWHRAPALGNADGRQRRQILELYGRNFVRQRLPKIEPGLRQLGQRQLHQLHLGGPLEILDIM